MTKSQQAQQTFNILTGKVGGECLKCRFFFLPECGHKPRYDPDSGYNPGVPVRVGCEYFLPFTRWQGFKLRLKGILDLIAIDFT